MEREPAPLDDRARRMLAAAEDEARVLGHAYLGTEHVLLGMLATTGDPAGRVAASFGLDLEQARADVVEICGQGASEPVEGELPWTPRLSGVLQLAVREALTLRRDRVGSEHVLLGVWADDGGVAVYLLRAAGVTDDRLRAAVAAL
jgi:ATP-dependent Clp protease ATP-binding subunit ClpC